MAGFKFDIGTSLGNNNANSIKKPGIIFSSEEQEVVLQRLAANYPAFHMYQNLNKWDYFDLIIITLIKQLNDLIGQLPVDTLVDDFKDKLLKTLFQWYLPLLDDYKNLLLRNTPSSNSTIDIDSLNALMEWCTQKLRETVELKCANQDVFAPWVFHTRSKIEDYWSLAVSIQLSIGKTRMKAEKALNKTPFWFLEFFDPQFSITEKVLWKHHWVDSKLNESYANLDYTYKVANGKLLIITNDSSQFYRIYNENGELSKAIKQLFFSWAIPNQLALHDALCKTLYCKNTASLIAENSENLEIGEKYQVITWDRWDIHDGFLVIKDENGKDTRIKIFEDWSWKQYKNWEGRVPNFFSQTLVSMVRKKKIPTSMALYKKVRTILDMLVVNWESIFPDWWDSSTISIKEFIEFFQKVSWGKEVDPWLFDRAYNWYYKWGLNQAAFKEILEWKEGQLFFIDIKDMWSINMKDFWTCLWKVLNGDMTHEEAILESGSIMTNKFKSITAQLEHKFWKEKIHFSLWWDEIKIFIEGDCNVKRTVSKLHSIVVEQEIFWRITTTKKEKKQDWIALIDSLDKSTSISKKIEDLFAILERRLSSQIRELEQERYRFNEDTAKLSPHFSKLNKISECMLRLIFIIWEKKISSLNKRLEELYNFHIEIPNTETNEVWYTTSLEDSSIYINGKKFRIWDVFNLTNQKIKSETSFTDMLDNLWLDREAKKAA